ncbi:MAG: hypothetical protein C0413_02220 [Clostridiales bacterium]|nr:hypothetical protein [Clostridiales bacterium]
MSIITSRDIVKTEFGKRLSERRNKFHFSQERLAELLEVSRESISKYERGKAIPDMFFLKKASKALNCSYEYLLGEVDYVKPQHKDIEDMLGLSEIAITTLEQLSLVKNFIHIGRADLLDTINMLIEYTGGYNEHLITYDEKTLPTGRSYASGLVNKISEYLLFDVDTATYSFQNFMKGKSITYQAEIDAEIVSNLYIMDINNSLVELRKENAGRRSRARAEHRNNQTKIERERNQGEKHD